MQIIKVRSKRGKWTTKQIGTYEITYIKPQGAMTPGCQPEPAGGNLVLSEPVSAGQNTQTEAKDGPLSRSLDGPERSANSMEMPPR